MIFTKQNIIYFGIALIVGAICAFGVSSLTYQPVPLQVAENPFPPATPPPSAVETLKPQYIPGSTADQAKDAPKDPYAPAEPPVVVTTAPLPTITPVATETRVCCNGPWNQTYSQVTAQAQSTFALAQILPTVIIGIGVLMVIVVAFGKPLKFDDNGFQGVIGLIVALGGVLIALYIIAVVVGSISAAVTMSPCVPC